MFFNILISLFLFFLCSGFIICIFTLNPTFLIIWLIILRILIRGIFLLILNTWISYALFLLFTGGIIVLFSYILSLIMSTKISFFSATKISLIFWLVFRLFYSVEISRGEKLLITNLFFNSRNFLIIILALYLLLVLLRIVNMASSNAGPIKSFFTYEQ